MGVFHLSGLGLNPGAVTIPLTYTYFLLKQSKEGDLASQQFFAHSGEKQERLKGKPEAIIVFTSKEVISGELQSGDRAEAGPLLKDILKLHKGLEEESQSTRNFSEWRRYFEGNGVLHKFIEDGKGI